MRCLLAVEPEITEILKNSLCSMRKFSGWDFEVCSDARELVRYSGLSRPDVIVLSRQLPGDSHDKLLTHLRTMFSGSRIVIMVGKKGERANVYSRMAQSFGLNNIVTGQVPATPGDRPYTLPTALTHDIEEVIRPEDRGADDVSGISGNFESKAPPAEPEINHTKSPLEEEGPCLNGNSALGTLNDSLNSSDDDLGVNKPGAGIDVIEGNKSASATPAGRAVRIRRRVAKITEGAAGCNGNLPSERHDGIFTEEEKDCVKIGGNIGGNGKKAVDEEKVIRTEELLKSFVGNTGQEHYTLEVLPTGRGKLVLTTTNKGGAGKTTIALMVAVALAKCGVKTCLTDLDLAGPDVATFFKITGLPGIELLAERAFSTTLIDDLLVKVEENLWVLPGTMDASAPYFETGKMGRIHDYLLSRFSIVVADTPPGFWKEEHAAIHEVFARADRVLAIMDQSAFSEKEAEAYAPKLLRFMVSPDRIRLVLNKYDPQLHDAKLIEKYFNNNLNISDKNMLPRVAATIPMQWKEHVQSTHSGKVVGLEDSYNQIHNLAREIAGLAGYKYDGPEEKKSQKSGGLLTLSSLIGKINLGRRKKR